jgi:hypothetical protein
MAVPLSAAILLAGCASSPVTSPDMAPAAKECLEPVTYEQEFLVERGMPSMGSGTAKVQVPDHGNATAFTIQVSWDATLPTNEKIAAYLWQKGETVIDSQQGTSPLRFQRHAEFSELAPEYRLSFQTPDRIPYPILLQEVLLRVEVMYAC